MKLLPIALALAVGGAILLIIGINASDSFSSSISQFFNGKPTDKAVWFMVGGAAALVAGIVTGALSLRKAA